MNRRTMKWLMAAALLSLPIMSQAQDKLIRINVEDNAWRKNHKQMSFFDREMARLLMPQGAAFGVECIPSFSTEWTLTYDSVAHVLVCKEAQKSVWHATYTALHKLKKIKKNRSKWVLRKRPNDYVAPDVRTSVLPVTDDQVWMLRSVWTSAFHNAENREVFILDGTEWKFFINGRQAKSHRENNALVKFVNDLRNAVSTGNANRKDSIINNGFQNVIASLEAVEKPRRNPDSIVVITDGQQQPDSLRRLIQHRAKQFYHRQGKLVTYISMWAEYGAKKEFGIDCPVLQLKTVADTLNDAYISRHPEMQQTLRHVSGVVLDENNQPLADAWVGIYGPKAGAPTDSTGHFSFWLPRDTNSLYAEHPKCQELRNIDVTDAPIRICLKPKEQKKMKDYREVF